MPRPRKSARLWLRPGRDDRAAIWVILDGGREVSTGCGAGASAEAEQALADYIAQKHDPKAARGGDPNKARVADALAVYYTDRVLRDKLPRPDAIKRRLDRLNEFFGANTVGEITGDRQRQYADERQFSSSARRELEDLAAAINFYNKDKMGGVQSLFRPVLPDAPLPRERNLTRDQIAKLVWTAWRMRQRNRGGTLGNYTSKHIARFIITAFYTGSRAGVVCGAALMPTIGRGYVDLDTGLFHRKPLGARETNKRAPTVELYPGVLAHMRRWKRLGISNQSVIEYNGKPVLRIKRGWETLRANAGLGDDVLQHTLRHAAISWMLWKGISASDVSEYCGVSEAIIKKHYKHFIRDGFRRVFAGMRDRKAAS